MRVGVTRQDLLESSADLADREGLAAVTLARLAAMKGIRTPTVSHHVGSLSQLRCDLAVLAVEELTDHVQGAIDGRTGTDAVRAAYTAYRRFVLDHPGRYAASIDTPDPSEERRLAAAGRLAQSLQDVFHQIGLDDEDANRAARLLRAAVHGYATLELSSAWQTPLDDDESFEWLLEVIIDGLTGGPKRNLIPLD